jgi:PPOX class probable F420-dependent enzyme
VSQRARIRMTDEEARAFLDEPRTMTVATLDAFGHPHLVAMWYGFVDDRPAFWTYAKSQKVVNLRRDPRITVLVEAGETYHELRGVQLRGTGTVTDDPETVLAVGEDVFRRYQRTEVTEDVRDGLRDQASKRVAVLIEVQELVSWDHRKLGCAY